MKLCFNGPNRVGNLLLRDIDISSDTYFSNITEFQLIENMLWSDETPQDRSLTAADSVMIAFFEPPSSNHTQHVLVVYCLIRESRIQLSRSF